jgi:hypothetical protein
MGLGDLSEPLGIAFNERGLLYVAERGNDRIQVFRVDFQLGGDLNDDGQIDVADIEVLATAIRRGDQNFHFDFDESGQVDKADLGELVHIEMKTWIGDANLDSEFNSSDLVTVFTVGTYETGQKASWGTGDWNADGAFGSGDLVFAFQDGGYEQGPRVAISPVPEPCTIRLLLLAAIAFVGRSSGFSAVDRSKPVGRLSV